MLTKTDIEGLTYFQIELRQNLIAKLNELYAQGRDFLNELLSNKTAMNPTRKLISEARNMVARHRNKFIESGERRIANMYNLELNALGDILVIFAGNAVTIQEFAKFSELRNDLLSFAFAIESAIKTIESANL